MKKSLPVAALLATICLDSYTVAMFTVKGLAQAEDSTRYRFMSVEIPSKIPSQETCVRSNSVLLEPTRTGETQELASKSQNDGRLGVKLDINSRTELKRTRTNEFWSRFIDFRTIFFKEDDLYWAQVKRRYKKGKNEAINEDVTSELKNVKSYDDLVKLWPALKEPSYSAISSSYNDLNVKLSTQSKKDSDWNKLRFCENIEGVFNIFGFLVKEDLLNPKELLFWFRKDNIPGIVAHYVEDQYIDTMKGYWPLSLNSFSDEQNIYHFFSVLEHDDWKKLNHQIISLFYKSKKNVSEAFRTLVQTFRSPRFLAGLSSNDGLVANFATKLISFLDDSDKEQFSSLKKGDIKKFARFTVHALKYIRSYASPEVLGDFYPELKDGLAGKKLDVFQFLGQFIDTIGLASKVEDKLDFPLIPKKISDINESEIKRIIEQNYKFFDAFPELAEAGRDLQENIGKMSQFVDELSPTYLAGIQKWLKNPKQEKMRLRIQRKSNVIEEIFWKDQNEAIDSNRKRARGCSMSTDASKSIFEISF